MLEIYAKAVVTVAVIVVVVIVALQTFCRCVESAIIFCKVCDSSASMNKEENVISQFLSFCKSFFLRNRISLVKSFGEF